MYQYNQAIALSKQLDSVFRYTNLSDVPANFLFTNYVAAYIKIDYLYSADPVYIDAYSLKSEYGMSSQTIGDIIRSKPAGYFNDIGPTSFTKYVKYAKYSDAVMSGYNLSMGTNDIAMSKTDVTTDFFINTTLTTVNGYIHDCNKDINGNINVKNGMLSASKTQKANVGLLTFADIGYIKKYNIINLNIVKDTNTDILTNLFIKLNIPNDTKSTFFMSLGGYLLPLSDNGALRYMGSGVFSLSLNKFGYLNKILESSKYCYLGDVENGISVSSLNNDYLTNEVTVKNYLTLANTFIFSIPAENIITNKTMIIKQPLYNSFFTIMPPNNPLFTSTGRMVDYYYVEQDYEYMVTATNIETNNYNAYGISSVTSPLINNQRDPNAPLRNNLTFRQFGFY